MPRNDHKKVILQLSEAYQNVYKENAEMEFDERGFAKNTEAGLERQDNIEYSKRHGEINVFDHLAKYVAEIAEDIIIDNPDEQVAPEAAFEMAVEMIQTDLKNIKYEEVKDKLESFYKTNPELTRGIYIKDSEDNES